MFECKSRGEKNAELINNLKVVSRGYQMILNTVLMSIDLILFVTSKTVLLLRCFCHELNW